MYLTADQALCLSEHVLELFQHQRSLTSNLVLRYKVLVDNSPAGRNCHVAAATLRVINQDQEVQKLRQYLQDLQGLATKLLQELPRE